MKTDIYNLQGQKVAKIDVPSEIAGIKFNPDLVHQVYRVYLFNRRKPLAFTKDRSEVRGGGKKPWPQKGTGRARHSSIRSPLWKGGGVTFGPRHKEENRKLKINKKVKKKALTMVFNQKIKDGEVIVLDKWNFKENKTKEADKILKMLLSSKVKSLRGKSSLPKVLIILDEEQKEIKKIVRNLPYVSTVFLNNLTIVELLNHKFVLFDKKTGEKIINLISVS